MAPRAGGESDKYGNRYEGAWTVKHLLYCLGGEDKSITVEDLGDLGDGAEFTFRKGDRVEVHQVKRQHGTANSWSVSSLNALKIWANARSHVEAGRAFHFVSLLPAFVIQEMADRARRSQDLPSFVANFLTNEPLRTAFTELSSPTVLGSPDKAWEVLRSFWISWSDEQEIVQTNAALADRYLEGATGALMSVALGDLVVNNLAVELTAERIEKELPKYGLSRITSDRQASLHLESQPPRVDPASVRRHSVGEAVRVQRRLGTTPVDLTFPSRLVSVLEEVESREHLAESVADVGDWLNSVVQDTRALLLPPAARSDREIPQHPDPILKTQNCLTDLEEAACTLHDATDKLTLPNWGCERAIAQANTAITVLAELSGLLHTLRDAAYDDYLSLKPNPDATFAVRKAADVFFGAIDSKKIVDDLLVRYKTESSGMIIVEGGWGTGKSFHLGRFAEERLEQGSPTIFVSGGQLRDANSPWLLQIATQNGGVSEEQVLGLLNDEASHANRLGFLIIDAINEAAGDVQTQVEELLHHLRSRPRLLVVLSRRVDNAAASSIGPPPPGGVPALRCGARCRMGHIAQLLRSATCSRTLGNPGLQKPPCSANVRQGRQSQPRQRPDTNQPRGTPQSLARPPWRRVHHQARAPSRKSPHQPWGIARCPRCHRQQT